MKKINGKCALCGKVCDLTFEHIPPRVALNSSRSKQYKGIDFLKNDHRMIWETEGMRYIIQQKGKGLYSLCSECNNNTGSFYGSAYFEFVKRAIILKNSSIPDNCSIVEFKQIHPLRIIKQICSMFCSINPNMEYMDDIRHFVLNKESTQFDKNKYRIQMYFNYGALTKYNGYTCEVSIGGPTIELSELLVPPFGFQLIYDPNSSIKYQGVDITCFVDFQYDEIADIGIPIIIKDVNNIFPNDYRTAEEIRACILQSEKGIQ